MIKIISCGYLLLLLAIGCTTPPTEGTIPQKLADAMPQIGKWMYKDTIGDHPAQWLGIPLGSKTLFEPINLIIVDTISNSESASRRLMEEKFKAAGFGARPGHTAAYRGKMDNRDYYQFPDTGSNKAFANYLWTFTSDHARLFGPYKKNNMFFWIGAASRERGLSHNYVTFKGATTEIAEKLTSFSAADNMGYYPLKNTQNNVTDTTGDHDGFAVVLQIK